MRLRPMEVVCVLNAMYVAFDELCQKNHIYKVRFVCWVSRGSILQTPPPDCYRCILLLLLLLIYIYI